MDTINQNGNLRGMKLDLNPGYPGLIESEAYKVSMMHSQSIMSNAFSKSNFIIPLSDLYHLVSCSYGVESISIFDES